MSSQISHRNEFGRKRGDGQDDYLQIHGAQVIVLSVTSFLSHLFFVCHLFFVRLTTNLLTTNLRFKC